MNIISFEQDRISRYEQYWNSITPTTNNEFFLRWLFAFTSIHSTWQSNVRCYNHIKNFEQWINNKSKLSELLILSRAGLQQNRLEAIWDFKNKFFENPNQFKKSSDESWFSLRNRLAKDLKGIGLAKTSFALELCYPNSVGVVCLDVHILRLLNMNILGYKVSSNKDVNEYTKGEEYWLEKTNKLNTSPYITRCIYWDDLQNHSDSRYWSKCLEPQMELDLEYIM